LRSELVLNADEHESYGHTNGLSPENNQIILLTIMRMTGFSLGDDKSTVPP
jgi:hypothetical protein